MLEDVPQLILIHEVVGFMRSIKAMYIRHRNSCDLSIAVVKVKIWSAQPRPRRDQYWLLLSWHATTHSMWVNRFADDFADCTQQGNPTIIIALTPRALILK